jgi:hypothetical protein
MIRMTTLPTVNQINREEGQAEYRKQFIERMERKLAYKTAAQRQRHKAFRTRLQQLREW